MKILIKRSVQGIQTGIVIGLLMSLIFSYLNHANSYFVSSPQFYNNFAKPLTAVLTSVILWALMGLVFGLGAAVFTLEKWSLLKRTIVHFVISYFGFTPLAIFAGWFPLNPYYLVSFTVTFILVYVIIWLVEINIVRKQINQINRSIKKM